MTDGWVMSELRVYLHNSPVGLLDQDDEDLFTFRYDEEWLQSPDAYALSRMLPLEAKTFTGKKVRPFFAGILPEEGPRRRIDKILGISAGNDFALLERIGGECAGAVCVLPEGETPKETSPPQRVLTEKELSDIIKELPTRPLMTGRGELRLSLAGAQDKLPIIYQDGDFALPTDHRPTTHILKPEPDHYPGLAANEYFCMTLAKRMGIKVAETELLMIDEKPCLLSQRYDRSIDSSGSVQRIHQEDFCQALGFPPERKYQAEGGPRLFDCISLIRSWSSIPALDIPAFIDSLIYNILIGNADAHGKNFSFLYRHEERRMAPLYDLVSTIAWPHLSTNAAMKIDGSDSINAFNPGGWRKMAEKAELSWPLLKGRMQSISSNTLKQLDDKDWPHAITGTPLPQTIRERAERILTMLEQ